MDTSSASAAAPQASTSADSNFEIKKALMGLLCDHDKSKPTNIQIVRFEYKMNACTSSKRPMLSM